MFVFCAKLHRNRNKIQYHRVIYLFLICVLIFVNFKNFLFNITMGSVQSVDKDIEEGCEELVFCFNSLSSEYDNSCSLYGSSSSVLNLAENYFLEDSSKHNKKTSYQYFPSSNQPVMCLESEEDLLDDVSCQDCGPGGGGGGWWKNCTDIYCYTEDGVCCGGVGGRL